MLDFLSWGHVVVIALAALFIFGPEKLPTLAQDAARGLKQVRETAGAVRAQMRDELGEDFTELRDLDLRRYRPRTFLRDQLFGEEEPAAPARALPDRPRPQVRLLPPPFDVDAT